MKMTSKPQMSVMERRNFLKTIACLPIWFTIREAFSAQKTNITTRTVAARPVYTEEFLEDWESERCLTTSEKPAHRMLKQALQEAEG